MSNIRLIHEIPLHILQEFIVLIRTNEKFIGDGKVGEYYINKSERLATIIYDNEKISYTANFTKDEEGNWFFNDKMTVRESLKKSVKKRVIDKYFTEAPQVKEELE